MKGVVTLILLLWVNLGANSGVTGSIVRAKEGPLSRLFRREVFDSSSPVLQISNLEATVHGGNRATVKWENATGPVTGYNMTVCLISDPPRCESATGQKTSYNLHHLESGSMYQVDVYAYFKDGGDTTNGRNERIFFTTTKLPSVENLEATPLGSTSVELKWAPSEDNVTQFDIDACPADGGACVHAFTSNTTHILRGLTPETTYKIHVRSAVEEDKELSFGHATTVSATTTLLPEISDVVIRATCDHFIIASWDYASEGITGFLLNLCTEGQACTTRSVDKDDREHQFRVDPVRRLYTLSIEAYLWRGNAKHSSPVVNASVTSFPQVPSLDRFEVEPVSSNQVRASWSNGFDADVRILVCVSQSTERNCANYVAHGTQKSYTISGLSSGTKYSVEATPAVKLGDHSRPTCSGPPAVREVATLTEAFCRYDDALMQTIKQISDNVKALTRRRSQFNPNRRDDDISTKCELLEAKLRTLPEKDVNDCFDDIDNLIETYKRKTSDLSSE
uniref:Cell adhesion molecule n=1 Tax=Rhipicephalus zambeziensis TaxID=60191 RepID=A0A224YUZ9_9ACAR